MNISIIKEKIGVYAHAHLLDMVLILTELCGRDVAYHTSTVITHTNNMNQLSKLSPTTLLGVCNLYMRFGDRTLGSAMICEPSLNFPRFKVEISVGSLTHYKIWDFFTSNPNSPESAEYIETHLANFLIAGMGMSDPKRFYSIFNRALKYIPRKKLMSIIRRNIYYIQSTDILILILDTFGEEIKIPKNYPFRLTHRYMTSVNFAAILEIIVKRKRLDGGIRMLFRYIDTKNCTSFETVGRIIEHLISNGKWTLEGLFIECILHWRCRHIPNSIISPREWRNFEENPALAWLLDAGVRVECVLDSRRLRWNLSSRLCELIYNESMHIQMERGSEWILQNV